MNVAVGLGHFRDYESALDAMTRPGETFMPNALHVRTYEQIYREVYQPMYERLQPLYRCLANVFSR